MRRCPAIILFISIATVNYGRSILGIRCLCSQKRVRICFRDCQKLQVSAPRAPRSLFPTPNRVWTDIQEHCEEHLTCVERKANRTDILRPQFSRARWQFGHAKVHCTVPLARQRILKRFSQIVECFHCDFLECRSSSSLARSETLFVRTRDSLHTTLWYISVVAQAVFLKL